MLRGSKAEDTAKRDRRPIVESLHLLQRAVVRCASSQDTTSILEIGKWLAVTTPDCGTCIWGFMVPEGFPFIQ